MTRPPAEPVTHLGDGCFQVTEWRFAPGAETGWHVHGRDDVIVPLVDGALLLEKPGGTSRQAPLSRHVPCARRARTDRQGRMVEVDGCDPFTFAGERVALADSHRKARAG